MRDSDHIPKLVQGWFANDDVVGDDDPYDQVSDIDGLGPIFLVEGGEQVEKTLHFDGSAGEAN